jgi:hypothetical protein
MDVTLKYDANHRGKSGPHVADSGDDLKIRRLKEDILSSVLLTIDGVWIGNWIYKPLTGRNFK